MAESPESSVEQAHNRRLPDDLLQKLHAATERFHQAKKNLDLAMGSEDYSHQHTIDQATSELKNAEREVESISMEIHSTLKPPPGTEQNR
jgi:DNA polymerase III delta prime subunit